MGQVLLFFFSLEGKKTGTCAFVHLCFCRTLVMLHTGVVNADMTLGESCNVCFSMLPGL